MCILEEIGGHIFIPFHAGAGLQPLQNVTKSSEKWTVYYEKSG
jgi:hypothetical protein